MLTRSTNPLSKLLMRNFQVAHRRALPVFFAQSDASESRLQLCKCGTGSFHLLVRFPPGRIGYRPLRVIGLDLVIRQGVDQVLLTDVLEEVLLTPTLEHAIGDNNIALVPTACQDCCLVTLVGKPGHLE